MSEVNINEALMNINMIIMNINEHVVYSEWYIVSCCPCREPAHTETSAVTPMMPSSRSLEQESGRRHDDGSFTSCLQ